MVFIQKTIQILLIAILAIAAMNPSSVTRANVNRGLAPWHSSHFEQEAVVQPLLTFFLNPLDRLRSVWLVKSRPGVPIEEAGSTDRTDAPMIREDPPGTWGQKIGPLGKKARDLKAQIESSLKAIGVEPEMARALSNSLIRLTPRTLAQLVQWQVISAEDEQAILTREPLSPEQAAAVSRNLAALLEDYKKNSLTKTQQNYFAKRFAPVSVIREIENNTHISRSYLAELAERRGDFHRVVYDYFALTKVILPYVREQTFAWEIVIRHGDQSAGWVRQEMATEQTIEPIVGNSRNAWRILIRLGEEGAVIGSVYARLHHLEQTTENRQIVAELTQVPLSLVESILDHIEEVEPTDLERLMPTLKRLSAPAAPATSSIQLAIKKTEKLLGSRRKTAQKLGVDPKTVKNAEDGRPLYFSTQGHLARRLSVSS